MTTAYRPVSNKAQIIRHPLGMFIMSFEPAPEKNSITFESFNEVILFLKQYSSIDSLSFTQLIEKDVSELIKEILKNTTWKTFELCDIFCGSSTAYEFIDALRKNPVLKCALPENSRTESLEFYLFQHQAELGQKINAAKKTEPAQTAPPVEEAANTNSPKEKPVPLVVQPITENVEVSNPLPPIAEEPAKIISPKEKEIDLPVEKTNTANDEVSHLPPFTILAEDLRRSVFITIDLAFAVCALLSPLTQDVFSEIIEDQLNRRSSMVPLQMLIAKTIWNTNLLNESYNALLWNAIALAQPLPPAKVENVEGLPGLELIPDAPGGSWASDDENLSEGASRVGDEDVHQFSGDENLVLRGFRM